MKRMICLLLALLCLVSLCACGGSAAPEADTAPEAEAEPEAAEEAPEEVEATPEPVAMPPYEPFVTPYGFQVEFPEEYQHLKGELAWSCSSFGYKEAHLSLYYAEVPDGEREAFREMAAVASKNIDGWVPDWTRDYKNENIFDIIALKDDDATVEYYETVTLVDFINDYFGEIPDQAMRTSVPFYMDTVALENGWKLVVQRNQLCTFAGEELPIAQGLQHLSEEYREEALTLLENPDLLISSLKEAPWELPGQVGSKVSFVTQNLQGDTVSSEDILAGHKVTMVNVWATWCPPCIAELPDLEKLNAAFAEKDCQIIGICADATHGDSLKEALQILGDAGVTFPNLKLNMDMMWANVNTMPTTFFLSEDGTILTDPVVGASIGAYNSTLSKALAQVG